jgi:hypothetical protein
MPGETWFFVHLSSPGLAVSVEAWSVHSATIDFELWIPRRGLGMFDKFLHRKLLVEGLEGEGVITEQKIEAAKGQLGVMGFYVGVVGRIRFDDGTEATFSSKGLDTSKVGDLDAGAIVPVRYDAEHKHVVIDIPKLEAQKEAKKKAAAELLDLREREAVATAETTLAKRRQNKHHDRETGTK